MWNYITKGAMVGLIGSMTFMGVLNVYAATVPPWPSTGASNFPSAVNKVYSSTIPSTSIGQTTIPAAVANKGSAQNSQSSLEYMIPPFPGPGNNVPPLPPGSSLVPPWPIVLPPMHPPIHPPIFGGGVKCPWLFGYCSFRWPTTTQ